METEFALSLGTERWALPAESDTITIGRASNADIRLQADDQVSRIHARLGRTGTTWTLYDESRNGTGLNGRRLAAPTVLTDNDRIHIGRSVLTFHATTAPAPEPPAAAPAFIPSDLTTPPPAPTPAEPSAFTPAEPAFEPSAFTPAEPAFEPSAFTPAGPPVDPAPAYTPNEPGPAAEPAGRYTGPEPTSPADADGYSPFAPAEDAPSNFPLFPDEPPYQGADEDRPDEAPWAAYPSADNPEPARSPWDPSDRPAAQIDHPEPNWNESASWPDTSRSPQPERRPPDDDQPGGRLPVDRDSSEEVGTVRLLRVLLIAGAVIVLGLVINLIITFLADAPGGALRWLVPPAIALVVAMIVALLDAAAPNDRATGRLDVSIVIAIIAVLLGIGVGGFALTAGVEYVGGYLTGNESGEDRLIKPVAKTGAGLTITVENVTYTSHFTRIAVTVMNGGKQSVELPLDDTVAFTGGEGNSLRADTSRSQWPDSVPAGGSEHGTITFKGHLPDTTTAATLTLTPGNTAAAVPGITLSK